MSPEKTDIMLDDTDHLILELLQRDAHITMRELAKRLNMSPPGAAARVRRLEEEGVINGYHASINLEKVGLTVHGYILIEAVPYNKLDAFYDLIRRTPEVYSAETIIAGGREAVLRVACADTERLMDISRELYSFCHSSAAHLTATKPAKLEPVNTRPRKE